MAKGPHGEFRPNDPLKSGILVMRLAVRELSETDAIKESLKNPKAKGLNRRTLGPTSRPVHK